MTVEIVNDFKEGGKVFKKGEKYNTHNDSVIINNLYICDVPSPFFEHYFKIVGE